jgi:hypothetical protein
MTVTCGNCGKVYSTKPSIAQFNAGIADGQGVRNSQAGNACWNGTPVTLVFPSVAGMAATK